MANCYKRITKNLLGILRLDGGLLFLTLLGISMVFIDETTDPMVYLTISLVPFFAMLPAALITAFNVFNAFFKNHPEDFPRN